MKNSVIFVTLLLFLAVTSLFWLQVLRIKDLPPTERSAAPIITGEEAEAFINLAQELLIDYREPLPNLYGRDPFFREKPEQPKVAKAEPSDRFILSSIVHSDLHALAVVNGEIKAEGDTLYDEESGSEFVIESIDVGKVEITALGLPSARTDASEKKYTLKMAGAKAFK